MLQLVEACFRDLRRKLESDTALAIKRSLREIKERREELYSASSALKQMIGVEGLAMFASGDKFQGLLNRMNNFLQVQPLPDIKFTSEVERQIRDLLEGCVSQVEKSYQADDAPLAKSTWMQRSGSFAQFKYPELENTRESSFLKSGSHGFDHIKELMGRPASSSSLYRPTPK